MALTEKQYEQLRSAKLAEARKHGISEKQLDEYKGELFDGEREYLIRANPPGATGFPTGFAIGAAMCVLAALVLL